MQMCIRDRAIAGEQQRSAARAPEHDEQQELRRFQPVITVPCPCRRTVDLGYDMLDLRVCAQHEQPLAKNVLKQLANMDPFA